MGAWRNQRPRGQAEELVRKLASTGFVGSLNGWRDATGLARATVEQALIRLEGDAVRRLPDRLLKTPGKPPGMRAIYGPVGCADDAPATRMADVYIRASKDAMAAFPAWMTGVATHA